MSAAGFRVTVGAQQVLPDHSTITELRAEFRGNHEGLSRLEKLLDDREAELNEITTDKEQK